MSLSESVLEWQEKIKVSGDDANYGASLAKKMKPKTFIPYQDVEQAQGLHLSSIKIKWKPISFSR